MSNGEGGKGLGTLGDVFDRKALGEKLSAEVKPSAEESAKAKKSREAKEKYKAEKKHQAALRTHYGQVQKKFLETPSDERPAFLDSLGKDESDPAKQEAERLFLTRHPKSGPTPEAAPAEPAPAATTPAQTDSPSQSETNSEDAIRKSEHYKLLEEQLVKCNTDEEVADFLGGLIKDPKPGYEAIESLFIKDHTKGGQVPQALRRADQLPAQSLRGDKTSETLTEVESYRRYIEDQFSKNKIEILEKIERALAQPTDQHNRAYQEAIRSFLKETPAAAALLKDRQEMYKRAQEKGQEAGKAAPSAVAARPTAPRGRSAEQAAASSAEVANMLSVIKNLYNSKEAKDRDKVIQNIRKALAAPDTDVSFRDFKAAIAQFFEKNPQAKKEIEKTAAEKAAPVATRSASSDLLTQAKIDILQSLPETDEQRKAREAREARIRVEIQEREAKKQARRAAAEAAPTKEALELRNKAAVVLAELRTAEQEFKELDTWIGRHFRGSPFEIAKGKLKDKREEYSESSLEAAKVLGKKVEDLRAELETKFREAQERPGVISPPPDRAPGESEDQYLTRRERWQDSVKSGAKAVPKFVIGVVSTLLGVKVAETTVRFAAERLKLRGEKSKIAELVRDLEATRLARPGVEVSDMTETKAAALSARLEQLVRDGRLKEADATIINQKIEEILNKRARVEEKERQDLSAEVTRLLNDYLQKKISKMELGKQWLNTGFLLGGLQLARSTTYAGLAALQRAARAREEYERGLRAERLESGGEGRQSKFWERERAIFKDITVGATKDYLKGISGVFFDLVSGKPVRKADWAQKKMSFGKALSTTAIFAGFASVAHAEWNADGLMTGAQIDRLIDSMEYRGLAGTIGNNWLRNVDQLSLGHIKWASDGKLQVAAHPDGFKPPAEPAAPVDTTQSPEQIKAILDKLTKETETNFFQHHPEYQRLEAGQLVDVQAHPEGTVGLEIKLAVKEGGYEYLDRALRDLTIMEKGVAGHTFSTVDAAQVENALANLRELLQGRDLSFLKHEDLEGIATLGADKLIIHNYDKFHAFVEDKILAHSQSLLTPATLEKYHGVVATVNNTSDANWQHDVDVKTGVGDVKAYGHLSVELDHALIHRAEIAEARQMTAELGIDGSRLDASSVIDENHFKIQVDNNLMRVENGVINQIVTVIPGKDPLVTTLDTPVHLSDPYAEAELDVVFRSLQPEATSLESTLTQQLEQAHGHLLAAHPLGPDQEITFIGSDHQQHEGLIKPDGKLTFLDYQRLETPISIDQIGQDLPNLLPKNLHDLLTPKRIGSIVEPDGSVHLGKLEVKPTWLDEVSKKNTSSFVEAPPKSFLDVLFGPSQKARAYESLAQTIKAHPDSAATSVGDYIFKHIQEFSSWLPK